MKTMELQSDVHVNFAPTKGVNFFLNSDTQLVQRVVCALKMIEFPESCQ